ncbi:MAG: hypothetical protein Q8P68_01015, partial [Candidatus Peregrinibacteria bacterium]|nr:hypothetical protein [Candidatus Peregrinibacteria bacterium]
RLPFGAAQQRLCGFAHLQFATPNFAIGWHGSTVLLYQRQSSHNREPLAEIFLFFFGLSPNCFKKFSNFFFFFYKGKYGVSSATLRKRFF